MGGIYSEHGWTGAQKRPPFCYARDLSSQQVHSGWYFRNGDKEWTGVTASKDWTANYVRDANASQKSN